MSYKFSCKYHCGHSIDVADDVEQAKKYIEEHERMCNHNFLGLIERQRQIENTIDSLKFDLENVQKAINLHVQITEIPKIPIVPLKPPPLEPFDENPSGRGD